LKILEVASETESYVLISLIYLYIHAYIFFFLMTRHLNIDTECYETSTYLPLSFFLFDLLQSFILIHLGVNWARIARRGDLPWKPGKNSRSRFKGFYKLSMLVSDWCMWVVGCSMPGLIDAFSSQSYPVVVVGKTSQC
jgi:hypothetical protein